MQIRAVVLTILTAISCGGGDSKAPPAPPPPAEPIRGAGGDEDLRVMLAELAEGRGCDALKGQFRALRDKARPDVVTGILWIRDCSIRRRGTDLVLELATNGWQRVEKNQEQAGATFEVAQDVRFAATATIAGSLDVGYEPRTHVASLWFSPTRTPVVRFSPLSEIAVEEEGAWAETVGAVGTLVGKSPENQAEDQAQSEGKGDMTSQLANGLGATIDLCSGHVRNDLGRPGKGKMYEPGIGESSRIEHELHPTGLLLFGPYLAPKGMNAQLDVEKGRVRAALMCRAEAEVLAAAYLSGTEIPDVTSLAIKDIAGKATLRSGKTRCRVTLVVRSIPDATGAPARFRWTRPKQEWAESTGGALAKC